MKRFQNILLVINGNELNDGLFQQAARIVNSNNAALTISVLLPNIPNEYKGFLDAYEKSLAETIKQKLSTFSLPQNIPMTFETATPYFVKIIQHVIKEEVDLILKTAENDGDQKRKGFKSMDMSLLRKCPCPVWLYNGLNYSDHPKIVTAIDPFCYTSEGQDLNLKLLRIGQSLADNLHGSNTVLSCWEFEYEKFLRNSAFAKMEKEKVDKIIQQAKSAHNDAVDKVIAKSGANIPNVIKERGEPSKAIPAFIERQNIDILVMGTVARTGIPGFLIGNTAENVIQNISCGMFAVKPAGFISPIKAY